MNINPSLAADAKINSALSLINQRLDQLVPLSDQPLQKAVRFSIVDKGKRVRPLLLLATLTHFGVDDAKGLDAACALEMLHAASLIFDDLPCMDDDAMRRGHPAVHIKFGDDVAILAGLSLNNYAYEILAADDGLTEKARLRLVKLYAEATGAQGLSAGQHADLRQPDLHPDDVNDLKTGMLFKAAMLGAAIIADAHEERKTAMQTCGKALGLAFQMLDDAADSDAAAASQEQLQFHIKTALDCLGEPQQNSYLPLLIKTIFASALL